MKPLGDRIIVEPEKAVETTKGGIYIPEVAKEKPLKGTVIKVGNGTSDDKMDIQEGDTVLYSKHSGIEITIDDKKYLVMRQSEVLIVM